MDTDSDLYLMAKLSSDSQKTKVFLEVGVENECFKDILPNKIFSNTI